MSQFFKNKNALTTTILVAFVAMTVLLGTVAFVLRDKVTPPKPAPEVQDSVQEEDSSVQDSEAPQEPEEEEEPLPEQPALPITFNRPDTMKAVYLEVGTDFLKAGTDAQTIYAEVDKAIEQALQLGMNTLMVNTFAKDGTLHMIQSMTSATSEDVLSYIVAKAEEKGLYVYAVYDLSLVAKEGTIVPVEQLNAQSINDVLLSFKEFVSKYNTLDGVLLTGYYNIENTESYSIYAQNGGGIGYENYMLENARSLFRGASQLVRSKAPNVQVGLLADNPWANLQENEEGSNTLAKFTALVDGNADTRAYVEDKLVDFVVANAYGAITDQNLAFASVVSWWNDVAEKAGIPLYVGQASSSVATEATGWAAPDQLTRQLIAMENYNGVEGSVFNSLPALVANPKESTKLMVDYFNNNVNPDHILKELTFTNPTQTAISVFEEDFTFQGASDPNFEVKMGEEKIETDQNGYFSVTVPLAPGDNTFSFSHKEKTITVTINRQVQIIKEVIPTGSVTIDGGMEVTVTVIAYQDAQVSASVGSQTIQLSIDETEQDEELRGTTYKKFKGTFTAPAATASVQNLGTISISATWSGITKTAQGANISVNKKAVIGNGKLVQVGSTFAETFPTNKLNNLSDPNYFPLPKGTLDYTMGDEVVYKDGSNIYTYYNLASGLRVYTKDITSAGNEEVEGNKIEGITVAADGKSAGYRYTKVILASTKRVPYNTRYTGDSIQFTFEYTDTVPENMTLNKNPLFSSATWSGSTLILKLLKPGSFLGYKAEYTSEGLVLSFNNPTSISGARIVVDPGHGSKDPGASGFNPNYPESQINWAVAQKLAAALENEGATVKLINTMGTEPTMRNRMEQARAFAPHIYISVHSNSASSSAKGSEAYYFYPFAKNLAGYASSELSGAMNTTNRGGKYGLYYVTRESQFVSILAEMGFVTNQSEYNKLIDTKYQKKIASGLTNAISTFLQGAGAGNAGVSGTQSNGKAVTVKPGEIPKPEQDEDDSLKLDKTSLEMVVGNTVKLVATAKPDTDELYWKSSDSKVASVDKNGKVTAIKEGEAVITVENDETGAKVKCTVTVKKVDVKVEKVELDVASYTLQVGKTLGLTATVSPSKASVKEVTWTSGDKAVADVSSSGKVTAKAAGKTVITVTTSDGGKTATCTITVEGDSKPPEAGSKPVSGIELDASTLSMKEGDSTGLTPTVLPADAGNKTVTWTSSNPAVAEVSSSGKVSAKSEGKATITATTEEGGRTATCVVNVAKKESDFVGVSGISISIGALDLSVDEATFLGATISPSGATNPKVRWSSSDPDIAEVSSDGKVVAYQEGTAVITATAEDSGQTATCTITVYSTP